MFGRDILETKAISDNMWLFQPLNENIFFIHNYYVLVLQ